MSEHEATVDWTKTEQDEITSLYGQLKGEYQQEANKALFSGPQQKYGNARKILNNLIEAQEHPHGGLEKTVKGHNKPEGAWAPVVSLLETIGGFFYSPAKESHQPGHAPAYAGLPAYGH